MKGKDIEVEIKEETQEEIAKKVIEDIHKIIKDRKKDVKEAEDKLGEVLEKDVENIEEEDSHSYDW